MSTTPANPMTGPAFPAEDCDWLLKFLGVDEVVSGLTRPLTDAELATVDRIRAAVAQDVPARAAIMAASYDERPAVVDRLLAEDDAR